MLGILTAATGLPATDKSAALAPAGAAHLKGLWTASETKAELKNVTTTFLAAELHARSMLLGSARDRCWITRVRGDGVGHQLHAMLTLMALHNATLDDGRVVGYDACLEHDFKTNHEQNLPSNLRSEQRYMQRVNALACEQIKPAPPSFGGTIVKQKKTDCKNVGGQEMGSRRTYNEGLCKAGGLSVEEQLRLPSQCDPSVRYDFDNAWGVDPARFLVPNHESLVRPFRRAFDDDASDAQRAGALRVVVHVRGDDGKFRAGYDEAKARMRDVLVALMMAEPELRVRVHTDDVDAVDRFGLHNISGLPVEVRAPGDADAIEAMRDLSRADVLIASESSLSTIAAWIGYGHAKLQLAPSLGDWHQKGASADLQPWPPGVKTFESFLSEEGLKGVAQSLTAEGRDGVRRLRRILR